MRFPHLIKNVAGLTLVALSLLATQAATAQTVISDETLVTTTFVVNKTNATAICGKTGCQAITSMFSPIQVTCPAAMGKTCTFHISLDAKASVFAACHQCAPSSSGTGFYRFQVDDAAPTIGPTDSSGDYVFEVRVVTYSPPSGPSRESHPASVVAGVTNSTSNSHTITVSLGCRDVDHSSGCEARTFWSTMRVDVFEP
jgi:hypothetical protein